MCLNTSVFEILPCQENPMILHKQRRWNRSSILTCHWYRVHVSQPYSSNVRKWPCRLFCLLGKAQLAPDAPCNYIKGCTCLGNSVQQLSGHAPAEICKSAYILMCAPSIAIVGAGCISTSVFLGKMVSHKEHAAVERQLASA